MLCYYYCCCFVIFVVVVVGIVIESKNEVEAAAQFFTFSYRYGQLDKVFVLTGKSFGFVTFYKASALRFVLGSSSRVLLKVRVYLGSVFIKFD